MQFLTALALACFAALLSIAPAAADALTDRGGYLVAISGCNDCHTQGTFLGKPDMAHPLGGSDVGFSVPHQGVFVGPNLTPDPSGLGGWTRAQIAHVLTTGERPDGRILAPVMPWRALAHLTAADAQAIAAYLQSLKPVAYKVPGPFGVDETPSVLVMTVLPGPVFKALPKP